MSLKQSLKTLLCQKIDIELEKAEKEREDLVKEPEKVENEVEAVEIRRKIHILKSTSDLASWPNQTSQPITYVPTCRPVVNSQSFS